LIFFSVISCTLNAQTKFFDDFTYYNHYYDSLINVLGADSMQGTGYIQYQRWFDYWAPKLMPDLDYDDYRNNILNYAQNYTPPAGNSANGFEPKWHFIGPNDVPPGTEAKGVGQIHYIYRDQLNRLFACSPVGGLFSSTDEGMTWHNAGTDKGLPRSGVSSVAVDSHNPSIWYVTTGNGESYKNNLTWQQAIGLYRTTDAGATWQLLGLDAAQSMRKVIEVTANEENTHLVVTTTDGLYEVTDANTSSPATGLLIEEEEFYDVVQDLQHPEIIYASGSQGTGVYKYDLSTHTATMLIFMDSLPSAKFRRFSLKITPDAPDYLYAVFSAKDMENHLYRYNINLKKWVDKGNVWGISGYGRTLGWTIRPQKNSEENVCIYGRIVSPMFLYYDDLANDTIDNKIWVNKNQGPQTHVDYHYLMIEDNDSIIWAGTDGGVYRGVFVNDSTIDWVSRNNGLAVSTIYHIDAYYNIGTHATLLTSGQFDCGSNIYESDDDINWDIHNKTNGDGYMNTIISNNKYYLGYSEPPGIKLFDQNNETKLIYSNVTNCLQPDTVLWPVLNFHVIFAVKGNIVYGVGSQGVVKYTNGAWQSWSRFTDASLYPEMGCGHAGVWDIALSNNVTKYITTYGSTAHNDYYNYHRVYKQSVEDMWDWVLVENQPDTTKWINDIKVRNSDPDIVYVAMRKSNTSHAVYMVDATDPANAAWTGLDYNLPDNIVVNCLELHNNIIWIGTDRGVFYLNDANNQWVDCTRNLPNVEVKDLKIENNRVYAGTYGRGIWEASAPGCYSGEEVTLSGTIVGPDDEATYYGDIRILPGTTAVVYGTLKMGAGTRIIVERTAKLIVDGGTITKACPDMWQGIEVWGNSKAVQDTLHQGYVILKNGATLEYAEQAVATVKNENDVSDYDYTGGVIEADNAHFKNNIYSVAMFPYPKYYITVMTDNKSYFENCTFTYDSTFYFFYEIPKNHVRLIEVYGVSFVDNVFENTTTSAFAPQGRRGTGIFAVNAGFKVLKDMNTPEGNVFSRLDYGVRTYSYTGVHREVIIDGTDFDKNYTGCYLGAETFATVTRNTFNITGINGEKNNTFCGLYLDACTGYQVEENEFFSDYHVMAQTFAKCYGIVVNNSGSDDNMIYNNQFHNITFATQAQNQNRSSDGNSGLTIKCNDYQDNWQDISVTANQTGDLYGIRYAQGSNANLVTAPAGNTFSHIEDNNPYSDYFNGTSDIIYWQHVQDWPNPSVWVYPAFHNEPEVQPQNNPNGFHFIKEDACPTHLDPKTYTETKSDIAAAESNRTVYVDSLDNLTDAGNTTSMTLDVQTSYPDETMEVRQQLLNASPFLSDTVMVSAVEKEDVLPNSIVTEVLTANPQSAKSDKVLNKLNERDNPPNDNQMAVIHANDTVIGHKESLESQRDYYAAEKAEEVYRLIRMYAGDTAIQAKPDSIEAALGNIHTPASFYQQAFCRYNRGDSTGVIDVLNDIPSEFDLNGAQSAYHDYFEDYFNILLALQSEQKTFAEIDSTQKTVLYDIVNNTGGILQAYARNLLLIYKDGLEYHEPYIEIDTSTMKSAAVHNPVFGNRWPQDVYFKLYPNPAKEYITLEYDMDYTAEDPVAEILTLRGEHIETFRLHGTQGVKIIDLRSWVPGTYLIKLSTNGKTLQNEKFVKF